jgi:hypothetical protein
VKCPNNCQCNKHKAKRRLSNGHFAPNNTSLPGRRALAGSTYGDEQRARNRRATEERHAKGIDWRDTPSQRFDWDAAIARMRKIFDEVYGK